MRTEEQEMVSTARRLIRALGKHTAAIERNNAALERLVIVHDQHGDSVSQLAEQVGDVVAAMCWRLAPALNNVAARPGRK